MERVDTTLHAVWCPTGTYRGSVRHMSHTAVPGIASGSQKPGHQVRSTISLKHVYEIAKVPTRDGMAARTLVAAEVNSSHLAWHLRR
jgi:hypothetical protein